VVSQNLQILDTNYNVIKVNAHVKGMGFLVVVSGYWRYLRNRWG